ncbi:MAG: helix-turn-helix domain protein [Bacteriophage sp.]|nr:MAG: helix-turn-helix domain protein [Bacteriophage sp.]
MIEITSDFQTNERFARKHKQPFTKANELIFLLDEKRTDKNITYTDIFLKTGIKRANISRFFSCKTVPSLQTFIAINNAIALL